MAELLRALGRDPATIWRRRGLAIGAIALAGTMFVVGNVRGAHVTPCDGGEAEITSVWSANREAVIDHLGRLGPYGAAEAERLAGELDTYGTEWAAAHRGACLAHERHELTDPVYERSLGCLARARTSYETVIDVLENTTEPRLGNAIVAARGLPAADRCALDSAASIIPAPPRLLAEQANTLSNDIERARILATTDDPRGAAAASQVVVRATALGYQPLFARAKLAHGLALLEDQDATSAIPVLNDAWVAAIDAFDDITLVEAYAREVYARSVIAKPRDDDTRDALQIIDRVARRSGTAGAFSRALLFNNLGAVRLAAGDTTGARDWFDRSLAETGARDRDAELVATFANRALVTDDPAARDKLFASARDTLTHLLGAHHRKTLDVRFQAAFFIADASRAEAEARRAVRALSPLSRCGRGRDDRRLLLRARSARRRAWRPGGLAARDAAGARDRRPATPDGSGVSARARRQGRGLDRGRAPRRRGVPRSIVDEVQRRRCLPLHRRARSRARAARCRAR